MAIIIPKLGLRDLRDTELPEYAQDKVDKISGSAAFGGVQPTPAQLQTKKNQYEAALVAADDGTVADTEAKNVLRKELEEMLTIQAQNCAEIADGDLALYLTTGYEAKDTQGTPVGELQRPDMQKLEPSENIGELKADWSTVKNASNYTVRAYTNEADPESSVVYNEIVSPSKTTLQGLPSGERIFVDIRANGGSTGYSPWSEAMWARPR